MVSVGEGPPKSDQEILGRIAFANHATRHPSYVAPDEWETTLQPALKKVSLSTLQKITGLSRSTLIELRAGRIAEIRS